MASSSPALERGKRKTVPAVASKKRSQTPIPRIREVVGQVTSYQCTLAMRQHLWSPAGASSLPSMPWTAPGIAAALTAVPPPHHGDYLQSDAKMIQWSLLSRKARNVSTFGKAAVV